MLVIQQCGPFRYIMQSAESRHGWAELAIRGNLHQRNEAVSTEILKLI